jgi:hypothetical protein
MFRCSRFIMLVDKSYSVSYLSMANLNFDEKDTIAQESLFSNLVFGKNRDCTSGVYLTVLRLLLHVEVGLIKFMNFLVEHVGYLSKK